MKKFLTFIISLGFIYLGGCSSHKHFVVRESEITFKTIHQAITENNNQLHRINAEGSLSIETPQFAYNLSFILSMQKPDSILLKIVGPFGMSIGSLFLTPSQFRFYNSVSNEIVWGEPKPENLNRVTKLPLSYYDIVSLFTGGTFLQIDDREPDDFKIEDGYGLAIFASNSGKRYYWIDLETLLITKIQNVNSNGDVILELRFSRFNHYDGFILPHSISIVQENEGRQLSLAYSEVYPNPEQLDFHFDVPINVREVYLK